jgi:phage virion morphogenesis protein
MSGVSFSLDGKESALATLAKAVAALASPEPLYDDIGAGLVLSTEMRFAAETDPDGNPWPKSLRAQLTGGKTLTDTGRLAGSITHEVSDRGVAVGTNLFYAAIHQFGGTIRAKTSKGLRFRAGGNGGWVTKMSVDIAQRAFLGIDDDDEKMIEVMSERYLATATGQGGGADAGR